jgi:hypothetical protein
MWAACACALGLALVVSATPAAALTMGGIDTATFDSIAGSQVATTTNSFDFIPEVNGGDGLVTSTVYEGIGDASGLYVYTYSIELFDANVASVGAVLGMTFEFGVTPMTIDGIGNAFYIDDGSGDVAPDMAFYNATSMTAGFRFIPLIDNGETSLVFGLISPNAPTETLAQLYDSGATGGQVSVLSNGVPPVPEPSAALVFALGFAAFAGRCRTRR